MKKMIYAVLSILLMTGMQSCSDDAKEEIGAVDIVIPNYRVKASSRFQNDKETSRVEYIYSGENKLVKEESFRFDDNGTIQADEVKNYSYVGNKVIQETVYVPYESIIRKRETTFNNGKITKEEWYDYNEVDGYSLFETTNMTYDYNRLTKKVYVNGDYSYTDIYQYSSDNLSTIITSTNNVFDELVRFRYDDNILSRFDYYDSIGGVQNLFGFGEFSYSGNLVSSIKGVFYDDSFSIEFGYDVNGNLVSEQESDGHTITYTYELGQGNIRELSLPNGSGVYGGKSKNLIIF